MGEKEGGWQKGEEKPPSGEMQRPINQSITIKQTASPSQSHFNPAAL
jgi:hypothetical protein